MSSSIWYLYEFVRKKWFKKFTNAKSEKESYIEPERFRKIPVTVDFPEKCISCSACAESCPSDAILMKHNEEYNRIMPDFDDGSCINCGNCVESCPTEVLEMGTLRKEASGLSWNVPKKINLVIDSEVCVSCSSCEKVCPVDAISHNRFSIYKIDVNSCVSCKKCIDSCPVENAILTYDELSLSNKIDVSQYKKFDRERLGMNFKVEMDIIPEIPRIVPELCINCKNCVDVCPGLIDIEKLTVVTCVKCGHCLSVCPTSAIRTGTLAKITKNTKKCHTINDKKCIGCRICYKSCNVPNALNISKETNLPYIDPIYCVRCGICENVCPVDAVDILKTDVSLDISLKQKVRDEFGNILQKDLEEFTKSYVLLKEEIKEKGKKIISDTKIPEKNKKGD